MMRSMFSGVSGLRAHQSRMDVIGHNIANVNTTAFKASRMTFSDAFSQTIQGATGPNPDAGRGGTNPMQIGLGVNVSSVQRQMQPGAAQRTDDPLHMMIEGEGFFIVGDSTGTFFTRAGDFIRDEDWNIIMPSGLQLQGWPTDWTPLGRARDDNGNVIGPVRGPVQGIQINHEMRNIPPRATGSVEVGTRGNANINLAQGQSDGYILTNISFQDSLGNNYRLDVRLVWDETIPAVAGAGTTEAGGWIVQIANHIIRTEDNERFDFDTLPPGVTAPAADSPGSDGGWLNLSTHAGAAPPAASGHTLANGALAFNPNGNPAQLITGDVSNFTRYFQLSPANFDGMIPSLYFGQPHDSIVPATAERAIRIDFSGMTQHSGNTNLRSRNVDGLAPGRLQGFSIGMDGVITGVYSNGERLPLWQVALAEFDNPAGLAAMGGNLFMTTANSGEFDGIGGTPGSLGTNLLGGTLEMSNVDLAAEFTEMITTQRGFQANSRIISTSDEMLQELVNLRR